MSASFSEAFVNWLLDYYLVATLLLAVLWAAWRWIRQPAHRIAASWMVVVELVLLAVVCAMPMWPRISLIAKNAPETAANVPAAEPELQPKRLARPFDDPMKRIHAVERSEKKEAIAPAAPIVVPTKPWTWPERITAGYLCGFSLMIVWLCGGAFSAWRICRRAKRADSALMSELSIVVPPNRRLPRLLVSSRVANAVALGVFRPRIVLPAILAETGASPALRAVLAHEYAHLARRDLWLLALGRLLLLVLFVHPLFWWLRRAIRAEQELLADAFAAGENRHGYAETLLNLIRNSARVSPMSVSAAVGIWEGSSQLSRRIAMLLDETFRIHPTGSRCWKIPALGLLFIFGIASSLVTLTPARSEDQKDTTTKKESTATTVTKKSAESQETKKESLTITGTGTFVTSGSMTITGEEVKDAIFLPGYSSLSNSQAVAELKLTDEQKAALREIQKKGYAEDTKFYRESIQGKKLSEEEIHKIYRKHAKERQVAVRKELTEILAPEQYARLDRMELAKKAAYRAIQPEVIAQLGVTDLTQEQKDKLRSAQEAMYPAMSKADSETKAKMLAALNPEQQAKLRDAVLGPDGAIAFSENLVQLEGDKEGYFVPSIDPYPDFSRGMLRTPLGLTEKQEEQIKEIVGGEPGLSEKLAKEMKKLPPEEQKKAGPGTGGFTKVGGGTLTISRSSTYSHTPTVAGIGKVLTPEELKKQEAEQLAVLRIEREKRRLDWEKQPTVKLSIELRKKFEAILTPEQLAKYKEMAFDRVFYAEFNDPLLLHDIGASEQQMADIRRLDKEWQDEHQSNVREMGEKILNVLTPEQQEKLREGLERQEFGEPMPVGSSSSSDELKAESNTESASNGATSSAELSDQDKAIAEIKKLGGKVEFNENEPGKPVFMVILQHTKITDEGLEQLKAFPKLRNVLLGDTGITDAGMKRLAGMTQLWSLALWDTKVTDAGLKYVEGMHQLTVLYLGGLKITDAGLNCLKGLERLEVLTLQDSKISDAGLENLKGLEHLQLLNVSNTQVSDAGLERLKSHKRLTALVLSNTKITDAGLAHLKEMPQLFQIVAVGTDITDTGLKHLYGLKKLESLDLSATNVTDPGVKELHKALPQCKIDWAIAPGEEDKPATTK